MIKNNLKNKTKKQQKNTGITLIALVVTIIVLLILAGISISMLSGDNGILEKATDAKTKSDESKIRERIQLAYLSALSGGKGEITENTFKEELIKEFGASKITDQTISTSEDGKTWTVTIDDVSEDFKATQSAPKVASNLTDEEKTALQTNGIAEVIENDILNNNLKDNDKIKAVITGEVPIPVDATYKEGTKETGVIIEYKLSEFVWVPVPEINKMVMCTSHSGESQCDVKINVEGTALYCKNHNSTSDEIVGKLYAMNGGPNSFTKDLLTQTYIQDSNIREPDILRGESNPENNPGYVSYIENNGNSVPTLNTLQNNYKEMALSVAKYGGFFIGRYETSYDGTKVASIANVAPMTAVSNSGNLWYGMYNKQSNFTTSSDKMVSSMIWGSQYDAMLLWTLEGSNSLKVTEKTNGSNSGGGLKNTGNTETDKINNIYDLEGNVREWTLEADFTKRVTRGGNFAYSASPADRFSDGPTESYDSDGSRMTLYIK